MNEDTGADKKRYSLSLPAPLYEELKDLADNEGLSVVEVLRRFIRLGFYVTKIQRSSDKELCVVRDGELLEKLIVL